MLWIVRTVLLIAAVGLVLPLLYLAAVSAAALVATYRRPRQAAGESRHPVACTRFVLLIPAHNEEAVLGTLLESLRQLSYPAECYRIYVIADNCSDQTAALARASGLAQVYERQDSRRRGKGFALNWMLSKLQEEGVDYDACVIIDADSVVEPSLLSVLDEELRRGSAAGISLQAIQGSNAVLNASDSPGTALRWLALSLMNHVRPLGRNALGGSSTLTGNGMCLSRALLERYPWQAFSRGEDYQYYLMLVEQGVRVRYLPAAAVRSQMPTTFAQMRSQDLRWEAAEPEQSTLALALRLVSAGFRQHDWLRVEAVAELLTPPLSLLIAGTALVLAGALWLQWLPTTALALLITSCLLFYVSSPLFLLRPPRSLYKALLYAPAFVLWKLWVYLVLRHHKQKEKEWVRTSRVVSHK
jgi:cellulose synthase/poly-beta-1,6-N-acetylglucosamine synthase-like glycosyltransferase